MNLKGPRLLAPRGACDTHMHFYDAAVPAAPGGPPLPGHFDVPAYRAMQRRLGLERVIVVQPNAYQADNRVTLAALGPAARGVAVVGRDTPERMLWASNWPHPSVPKEQRPGDADLLDLLLDWAPEEAVRRRILADNPAELYGF